MRVALLTHEPFYPPSGGGSAEAVYLVRELVDRAHDVHIFCPAFPGGNNAERRFAVRFHEFQTWEMGRYTALRTAKYLLYPFFLARLVEFWIRRLRFDLILSQHAISAVAAGLLKRGTGVPVIMNFLDYLTAFMETWPSYLAPPPILEALKAFEISLPRRYSANAVLTVSDTLADHFRQTGYPSNRVLPIHYGFDSSLFPFVPEVDHSDYSGPPIVVMHGSLDHHHIGPIALGALRRVVESRPDTIFRFVGQRTGALESFLQRANREVPTARIEITGFVPYSEVSSRLRDATLGIVPYEESTGTHCAFVAKTVEYLASGLPVVSTPLDNAKRYFGNEPMVRFSEFDGHSFGDAILSWFSDGKSVRGQFAKVASDRVRANLDWRIICGRAVDFIESVCGPEGNRAPASL